MVQPETEADVQARQYQARLDQAAANLDEDQIMELRTAFRIFDKDNSGTVSADELQMVFKSLGQTVSEEEIMKLLSKFDVNNNAEIDFPEFILMMQERMKEPDVRDEYSAAFKIFDRKEDNTVQANELIQILQALDLPQAEEVAAVLNQFSDMNGQINYKEMIDKLLADAD